MNEKGDSLQAAADKVRELLNVTPKPQEFDGFRMAFLAVVERWLEEVRREVGGRS